jgi:hypothetical protein
MDIESRSAHLIDEINSQVLARQGLSAVDGCAVPVPASRIEA